MSGDGGAPQSAGRGLPFPGSARRVSPPRVLPGSRQEIGLLNAAICAAAAVAVRSRQPPRIFPTLARNRRLFRPWLRFAGRLMPRGSLPRADTELVILRVAVTSGSDYEWVHHVRLARRAGLSDEQISRVAEGPAADGWGPHERALLSAVDELAREHAIADPTWTQLAAAYGDAQLIELCLLAGHYRMLADALNSLGVQPERR